MRKLVSALILLTLLGCLTEAHGRGFLFGPYGGFVAGGGFAYSRGRLRIGGGFVGGQLYGFGPCGPYCPPWCGPGYTRVTSLTIVTAPPPPPSVIFLPPPPAPPPVFPEEIVPPPVMPRIPPPPPPPPAAKRDEEKPAKKPPRDPEMPRPPAPKVNAEDEYALLLIQGRESFKMQEYGRAAQRFREATRIGNKEGEPYFLLAQSLIAQGKYHDAHDAVVAGLERQPTWPTSGFRPLELYDEVLEYTDHMKTLAQAVERHPFDPELLFVYGYLLWFDGRADEASLYFSRALPRAKDPKPIQLFLRALPAGETL